MIAEEGRVVLVGTAHVSARSVEEVRATIRERRPATVVVELDEARLAALTKKAEWERLPLVDIVRRGRAPQLLAQALLASHQRRIARATGVAPGAEMLAAVEEAGAAGARVVLGDRDIGTTLRRAWALMGFREKVRVAWELTKAATGGEEHGEAAAEEVEKLLEEDTLTEAMADLATLAPRVKGVLVDERDQYLAHRIREAADASPGTVVAVVGAGHLRGVVANLRDPAGIRPLHELTQIPKAGVPFGKIIGWGLLGLVLALFGYGFYEGFTTGDFDRLRDALLAWLLVTGSLAALGALLARAHPWSIATAFLAAPFTTLHPALAAGWFAGYVEAVVRKPTVRDFEALSTIERVSDFWRNGVLRVLLVAALTNVGAMAGFYIGIGWLVELFR